MSSRVGFIEERVAILLPDSPQWAYAFFGSMKIGAWPCLNRS
jgi:acyl-CoA synthetase (AMP-forming)/AMP-acid ligase II